MIEYKVFNCGSFSIFDLNKRKNCIDEMVNSIMIPGVVFSHSPLKGTIDVRILDLIEFLIRVEENRSLLDFMSDDFKWFMNNLSLRKCKRCMKEIVFQRVSGELDGNLVELFRPFSENSFMESFGDVYCEKCASGV